LLASSQDAVALVPGALAIPSLAGDTVALPYSPAAYAVLRSELGWEWPIIADLRPTADTAPQDLAARAVRALVAGADLVLVRGGAAATIGAIEQAVAEGTLDSRRLDDAIRRVLRLKLGTAVPPGPTAS